MFDVDTVIGINAGPTGYDGSSIRSDADDKKELGEIIRMIEAAGERLDDLIIRYEAQGEDTSYLDEAADALSDAVDSLDEELDTSDE